MRQIAAAIPTAKASRDDPWRTDERTCPRERTEQENVAEQLTLRMFSAGGQLETKTIRPIAGEIPEGLHPLGRSVGSDTNVAVGMLYRHCPASSSGSPRTGW